MRVCLVSSEREAFACTFCPPHIYQPHVMEVWKPLWKDLKGKQSKIKPGAMAVGASGGPAKGEVETGIFSRVLARYKDVRGGVRHWVTLSLSLSARKLGASVPEYYVQAVGYKLNKLVTLLQVLSNPALWGTAISISSSSYVQCR